MNILVWATVGLIVSYILHNYFSQNTRGFTADIVLSILGAIEGGFLLVTSAGYSIHTFSIAGIVSAACGSMFFILLQRFFATTTDVSIYKKLQ